MIFTKGNIWLSRLILPCAKQTGTGLSHSFCPLMQFGQKVSSTRPQLDSKWQTFELGKKLNQVQLAFCWQLSKHSNSSSERRISSSWLLVHSPEVKHWRSLQFPGFGSTVANSKSTENKNFMLKLDQIRLNVNSWLMHIWSQ